ncbi:MAG: hypothetical protein ACRCXT_08095 [Paraclostridium sp.]
MELIRYTSERVQEIISKVFADKFTEFKISVSETVDIKNIRFNIVTEFEQNIVITMYPSTVKELPLISLDKGAYIPSSKISMEICINPVEEKQMEELIMLKNVLPGIIAGIIK